MKKLYRNDLILNIIIIALCVAVPLCFLLAETSGEKTVLISYNGNVKKQIELSDSGVYQLHGVEITVRDGRAFVSASNCPDGLCMKMKDAKNAGDSIICVPNRVSVKITGKSGKDGIDVIAG